MNDLWNFVFYKPTSLFGLLFHPLNILVAILIAILTLWFFDWYFAWHKKQGKKWAEKNEQSEPPKTS